MYIEEKSDDSCSDESEFLSPCISDIPISISISENLDRDNSVTSDPESQSSWDSRFHEEAEFIARIILIQGKNQILFLHKVHYPHLALVISLY